MKELRRLDGKVAIITGGVADGIGRATALLNLRCYQNGNYGLFPESFG